MSIYRNEDYRCGYESYEHRYSRGMSEFDGDYDYRQGWDEARRQELREEDEREERRIADEREERRMAEARENARRIYEERLSGEGEDNMEEQ